MKPGEIITVSSARTGILFALPEEAVPFVRRAKALGVSVACSGAGAKSAERTAGSLLRDSDIRVLVICGFAGGLAADLTPGSLLIARDVRDITTGDAYTVDPDLAARAEFLALPGISIRRGTLATAGRVLTTAAEKRDWADRMPADAVDMETSGAVRAAEAQGVAWLAVRAITDGVNDDFPFDFNALADADGNVRRGRVVAAALTHPWKIPALIRLGARSSLAARNLATFLESFLSTR